MSEYKVWWITGASSGLGESLARELATRPTRLILSGRNIAELERVADVCGRDRCLVLPFETTDYPNLTAVVQTALAWAGRIDCLICNAGISQRSLAIETDFSVYQKIIEVDLVAPIALTQLLLPAMVAAGGGRLIAISSVAGIIGAPLRTAYCAAKHGVFGYFDALRAENQHLGIDIHVIAPGSVKTNVSRNALNAGGQSRGESDAAIEAGMDPNEAASLILDAVENGARELILARGTEAHLVRLRRSDPDALFDTLAASVQAGYADKMASGLQPL